MRIDRILVATKPDLLLVVVVALLVGVASRSGGKWDLEKKSIGKTSLPDERVVKQKNMLGIWDVFWYLIW